MTNLSANGNLIEFHNVSVERQGKLVLRELSLKIAAGENVAIVGPNGSGKSTLLKMIVRELHPLALPGSYVRILGEERWDLLEVRKRLGILQNELIANASRILTSRDVVLSALFGSIGLWPHHEVTPEMHAKADAALEKARALAVAERYWNEISSGEARKVLIARALIHNPEALLLDEPSNSLDIAAQRELRATLRSLAQSGTSLILVTHHLAEIIPEITRVVLLKDGQIFRDGRREEALNREALSELFGVDLTGQEMGSLLQSW